MIEITKENIKKIILEQYPKQRFTCGDIIYAVASKYNKSVHGKIRNILVNLTKDNFLEYKIEIHGVPKYSSTDRKIKSAVYWLNKKD